MLKFTTLFIALLLAIQTNAQIKKGSILVGGQIALNSSNSNTVTQLNLTQLVQNNKQKNSLFGLNIGTAVKENKVIGLNLNFNSNTETRESSPNILFSNKSNQNEIGIFYREYKKIKKDFYFFGQADITAIFGNGTGTSNSNPLIQTVKQTGGRLYLSTGVGYAVLKKLQIEVSLPNVLGIQFTSTKFSESLPITRTQEVENFSFNSSLTSNNVIGNLGIGFRLTF